MLGLQRVFTGSSAQRGRVSTQIFRDDIMPMRVPADATTATVSIEVEQGGIALREVFIRMMADDAVSGIPGDSFLPAVASRTYD